MAINKYKLNIDDNGYIFGFYAVTSGEYDYEGQLANIPDLCEGWYKFENSNFVVDEKKKAEIMAQREKEAREAERESERLLAQIEYTAMMTDTLLEE